MQCNAYLCALDATINQMIIYLLILFRYLSYQVLLRITVNVEFETYLKAWKLTQNVKISIRLKLIGCIR